jgi:hypothetical protein
VSATEVRRRHVDAAGRTPRMLFVGFVAALAMLALPPAPARASFPGEAGRIAFARGLDIFVMDPDGGHVARLTGGPAVDQQPVWSPTGGAIAFSRQAGTGHPHIYVMSPSGTEIRRLTEAGTDDVDPAWSPDGSRIAFVRGTGAARLRILVMRADGTGERRVASGHSPAWSPDGRWLAFNRIVQGRGAIFLVHPDGTGLHRLTPSTVWADDPSWSPGGGSLAFTIVNTVLESSDIAVIAPDGHGIRRVTDDHPGADQEPAWSPAGGRIAFVRITENDSGQMVEHLHMVRAGKTDTGSAPGPGTKGTEPDWQPVCTIRGTGGDDVLRGTAGRDLICAGGGDDRIHARGGNDAVFAGPGDDVLVGGPGRDVLVGAPGNDHLYGGMGADLLSAHDGRQGNDVVDGGASADICRRDRGDVAVMCP